MPALPLFEPWIGLAVSSTATGFGRHVDTPAQRCDCRIESKRTGLGHPISNRMRAADETGRGEVGNDATESTAAATNAAPIPASAYARLADILIGNPHAQAALGISRGDSDDEVVEIHHPATMMVSSGQLTL